MTEKDDIKRLAREPQAPAYVVRLPGFLLEKEMGLGDVIKKVTYTFGIPPCSGCDRRSAILNHWVHFSRF